MSALLPVEKRLKHPLGPAIHAVLWRDWDPIGVCDWGPDDEYDSYVWPIIGKVVQDETAEQIADYLDWASNEQMECPRTRAFNLEIARKLIATKSGPTGPELEEEAP